MAYSPTPPDISSTALRNLHLLPDGVLNCAGKGMQRHMEACMHSNRGSPPLPPEVCICSVRELRERCMACVVLASFSKASGLTAAPPALAGTFCCSAETPASKALSWVLL